jgi:hypothetical protein
MKDIASNRAAKIFNQQTAKENIVSVLKEDKNRSLLHRIAGSTRSIEDENQSA